MASLWLVFYQMCSCLTSEGFVTGLAGCRWYQDCLQTWVNNSLRTKIKVLLNILKGIPFLVPSKDFSLLSKSDGLICDDKTLAGYKTWKKKKSGRWGHRCSELVTHSYFLFQCFLWRPLLFRICPVWFSSRFFHSVTRHWFYCLIIYCVLLSGSFWRC